MAETPTEAEILAIRRDLQDYATAIGNSATVDLYSAEALAQFKRDLRDVKGIKFSQVYDSANSIYFLDTDDNANNDDRCKNMIALLTIGYVFRDYSIKVSDSQWFDLYQFYEGKYADALSQAKLDVDLDESGAISTDEEQQSTQSFLRR